MILLDVMHGKKVERAPSVPKIWLDLAANLMERDYALFFDNPKFATATVIEAGLKCWCDGARVFLFPHRDVRYENGIYCHYRDGRCIGNVDIQGGWATLFDDPTDFDFNDPEVMICYHLFKSRLPIINSIEDVKKLKVPSLATYHRLYDDQVEYAVGIAGSKICPIGDCNSGTMAFCVSMLGMTNALIGLYDRPELLRALMDVGIRLSIIQAKFMTDKGIRVLRYNDSVANMNVLSPQMWRDFIYPYIRLFCDEVHAYCREARIYCHICGDIRPIVYDMVDTGLDCIAPLDPLGGVTVKEVRGMVGDEYMLMGGVNTMSFINETPEKIREEARQCITAGFRNGHYAVGSGCVVPRMANVDALRALQMASRDMMQL